MPREMVFAQVIGVVGTVLIGFGLYGYFLDGSHLHPLLNSSDVTPYDDYRGCRIVGSRTEAVDSDPAPNGETAGPQITLSLLAERSTRL